VWHAPGGDQTFVGSPLPQQTVEGGTIQVQIPAATSGVGGPGTSGAVRVLPNPGRSGRLLHLSLAREAGSEAHVFDLSGREVAHVRLAPAAGGWQADWPARDPSGRALPAGIYLVRGRAGAAARVVLLGP